MKKILLFLMPFVLLACSSGDSKEGGNDNGIDNGSEVPVITNAQLDDVLENSFKGSITVRKESKTYAHLREMTEEVLAQIEGQSKHGLPLLFVENNFPFIYNYHTGNQSDKEAVSKTMIGWLAAMQLSELCPSKRNRLYRAGYEAGGQGMDSNLYGYHFSTDPNVARLVASAVYAAMHTIAEPDIETMRNEVDGSWYRKNLADMLQDESGTHVTDDAFYVDLRKFMASAPGPYQPDFTDRSYLNPTFPDEKAPNRSLKVDMDIYNTIVEKYNLPDERAVQAIADKESDVHHIFGTDKRNVGGIYNFNAVFGASTIGETINPNGKIAALAKLVESAGATGRSILQHLDSSVGWYEYGRIRPGCSELHDGYRKSHTDDRLNVLTSFIIEDNDGSKQTYDDGDIEKYYLDENGNWTNPYVQSAEQYEDMVKDPLYANSYPSGHAAAIWSIAMTMIELYPLKADLIMRAANNFAESRVICRYHWNSDIIQGKVIGSVMNPVCHAVSDYDMLLEAARRETQK